MVNTRQYDTTRHNKTQHSTYSQISTDSYTFRLLKLAIIRLYAKESQKAIFTAANCK